MNGLELIQHLEWPLLATVITLQVLLHQSQHLQQQQRHQQRCRQQFRRLHLQQQHRPQLHVRRNVSSTVVNYVIKLETN